MTGQYPRATDTFIQREVAALRQRGVHVETLSIRRPQAKENVGPETQAELDRTFFVLEAGLLNIIKCHLAMIASSPARYCRSLWTALSIRPAGLKALVWQLFYFVEAAVIASRLQSSNLTHLHNHFSNSSCSAAMLAAEMGDFTFSFTMHGPNEFFEPHYWRLDEKIKRALFVCCISHFCRSQGMIFGPQEKWPRLHIVHCGVDPAQFPAVTHAGPGHRLLFVGRLTAVKGVPILLEALAKLRKDRPNLVLTIAGDGPDRTRLEAMVLRLNLSAHVRFAGYQSQLQVRTHLQETDVFVLPSFAEGVPVVLMEAMAAGVPVVTTRIAGIPELVEDGISGLLTSPGDAESFAAAIGKLLDDPDLRVRLGRAGRSKVAAEFDINREAAWLCDVLSNALAGRVMPVRPESTDRPIPAGEATSPAARLQ